MYFFASSSYRKILLPDYQYRYVKMLPSQRRTDMGYRVCLRLVRYLSVTVRRNSDVKDWRSLSGPVFLHFKMDGRS